MKPLRLFALAGLFIFAYSHFLFASDPAASCTSEIPIVAIGTNNVIIQGMQRESLVVEETKGPTMIMGVAPEAGPKRIVFVLDRGAHMDESATKLAEASIEKILQSARPDDKFGLFTAEKDPIRLNPMSPDTVLGVFHDRVSGRQSKGASVLDAISDAMHALEPAQSGDALFVLSGGDDFSDSRNRFANVYEELTEQRIRVFGMLFSYVMGGGMSPALIVQGGAIWTSPGSSGNAETLNSMAWGTGGYLVQENVRNAVRTYKLTEERVHEVTQLGLQQYGAIAQFYRLQVSRVANSKPQTIKLDLAPEWRKKKPAAVLIYPHQLPRCN